MGVVIKLKGNATNYLSLACNFNHRCKVNNVFEILANNMQIYPT
jgi:hypothetical protein